MRQYYFVGGMPEVVATYAQEKNLERVRAIHKSILSTYDQDFSKHVPVAEVPRIRMVSNSIPAQLAKENKKFVYGLTKERVRAREFELAISWLVDCGLVYKIQRIKKATMPLKIRPIEVKAEENLHAKSLRSFIGRHPELQGLRLSMSDYREEEWMTNVPLYAASIPYSLQYKQCTSAHESL